MCKNLSNIAILNIKGFDYCCIISGMRTSEANKLHAKYQFDEKSWNIIKQLSYVKMGKEILTIGNIEIEKNKFYRYISPVF